MPRRPAHKARQAAASPAKARALRAYDAGDLKGAFAAATDALRTAPRDADLLHLQGSVLAVTGRPAQALEKLLAADKARPMDPATLLSIAQTQRALQRFDDMNTTIERVLYLAPKLSQGVSLKAQSLRERGRYDEAAAALAPALEASPDDPVLLMAHAELCVATRQTEPGIASCERALASAELTPKLRRFAHFTLGSLLDQAGRYDDAFESYRAGNAMLEPGRLTRAETVTDQWTPELLASLAPSPERDETPLLILGMPRSGTTLTEQMLAAHPKIESVGESHALPELARTIPPAQITPGVATSLGQRYLAALSAVATDRTRRVIDKMPGNYMHLGLLSRVCPGARVIHMTRDPRDVCLSCYFQNFGASHTYSRDLALCARQYAEHLRLMAHWSAHTDLPILTLAYADLVREPEATIRRALDFAGLGFDEACLRYHESDRAVTTRSSDQVRRPVYRSSLARWRRYEKHIQPMTDALRDAGVQLPED